MKEDKIPCPKCKTIMIADIHTQKDIPELSIEQLKECDNWYCPKCDELYGREDLNEQQLP